jgi:multidrug efflux system outer membrane protein
VTGRLRLLAALLGSAAGLCACAITSTPQAPAPGVPSGWAEPAAAGATAPAPAWWLSFGSEELAALVAAALAANPDLAIATERVRQAEAQARIAGASLFPELNFSAATSRRETRPDGGAWIANEASSVVLSASYEIDLWGRNAAGLRSAESMLQATRFDLETVRLTLLAGIASGYFQVLSLRGRLAIARENLAIAERVLKVVDARARNGAASALDLARQQAAVLSLRASLAPLELQERQTLYALAILAGRAPEGFDIAGASVAALAVPLVAPGLPADLRGQRKRRRGAGRPAARHLPHRFGRTRERRAGEFPECAHGRNRDRRCVAATDLRRRPLARAGGCGRIARARAGRELSQVDPRSTR